jgi:hypothetical protein
MLPLLFTDSSVDYYSTLERVIMTICVQIVNRRQHTFPGTRILSFPNPEPPASIRSTDTLVSSDNLLATIAPADPAPTKINQFYFC